MTNTKSMTGAYLLLILGGVFGAHRFYLRKPLTAILFLFTFGLGGFGILFDLLMTASMVDAINAQANGQKPLTNAEKREIELKKLKEESEKLKKSWSDLKAVPAQIKKDFQETNRKAKAKREENLKKRETHWLTKNRASTPMVVAGLTALTFIAFIITVIATI